ncbi:M48 family metallopeptidase [Deinococcus radiophilus]|uniref:M48 metallopeptidase family protein n=1 Tax=Deinococcus radiophilus TaxID=32062 RepID=UPI003605F896
MSSRGHLNLNTALLHAPEECIDYVILHELCHLREFNHSARYYALLDQVRPDWRQQRERLNRVELVPAST